MIDQKLIKRKIIIRGFVEYIVNIISQSVHVVVGYVLNDNSLFCVLINLYSRCSPNSRFIPEIRASSLFILVSLIVHDDAHTVSSSGTGYSFIKKWGSLGTGDGEFNDTSGVAIDPKTSNVYVADYNNSRIQKFDSNGTFIKKWGSLGTGDGQFNNTLGVAVDPKTGNVYVADFFNSRIQVFAGLQ